LSIIYKNLIDLASPLESAYSIRVLRFRVLYIFA